MKKIIYLFLVFICSLYSFGQTDTENYVETTVYKSEYLGSFGQFSNYTKTLEVSDLVFGSNGSGNGSITIQDNILNITFNASWPSNSRLQSGVITSLNTSPILPNMELGDIMTPGGTSGFKMKIEDGNLIFYSQYFISSVSSNMTRILPNTSEYYTLNYNTNLGNPYTCTSGGGGGSSSLKIESGYVHLSVHGSWSETCEIKTGNIRYLTTVTLPDMELGVFYNSSGRTIYKAKIENNYLIYYTDETLPAYPTSVSNNKSLMLHRNDNFINRVISYYDGLGRPKQNIAVQAGGQRQDIVTPFEYDDYGRQEKQHLPYASSSTNRGNIRTNPLSELHSFYNTPKYENTTNPFSQVEFEDSPLNRILKQAAPGESWKLGNDHEIELDYKTNRVNEVRKLVANFVNNDPLKLELISNPSSYYATGELQKTITKDENHPGTTTKNHTIEEFINIEGKVILKRTYADIDIDGDNLLELQVPHDTYYVYDKYGNLAYVIPPKVNLDDGVSASELNELCYQYIYDKRNRLIEKKIPGKGDASNWEYFVYNKRNQPIMTQDANLKAQNQWLFTLYDEFGRVAYTGLDSGNTKTRAVLQTEADAATNQFVTKIENPNTYAGTLTYYSKNAYPTSFDEVHTITYYDDYEIGNQVAFNPANGAGTWEGMTPVANVKSLPTVAQVRVLGTNKWITTTTYYDQKGRPWEIHVKNEYLDSEDWILNKLDFIGNIIKTRSRHQKGNNPAIVTVDNFTYDHMNRLINYRQCIGTDSLSDSCGGIDQSLEGNPIFSESITGVVNELASSSITLSPGFHTIATENTTFSAKIRELGGELIAANFYDELGQLSSKKVGNKESNPLQKVDYAYNIRGWLKSINQGTTSNGDLFGFRIDYDNGAIPLYNGNIAKTSWRTANDNVTRGYAYTYDALNRINSGISNDNKYNLSNVTYDKDGNILSLNRKGRLNAGATSFGDMDLLSYTYDGGNKLLKVADTGNVNFGFKDGSNTNNDFDYDLNGNMTKDQNKGITNITYNHLNLPETVSISNAQGTGTISYIYDATGAKLKKTAPSGGSLITTEYTGNYIYKNGVLEFFNHPEGYVEKEDDRFKYVYQYKDHLGNIRLSYKDANKDGNITTSEIVEEKHYYPFGLQHKGYNNTITGRKHNYGFNGKEENNELGLEWLDYGARNYDASLGRWMNIDPMADKYVDLSPYNFTANNPIYFIDPDGMDVEPALNQSGTIQQAVQQWKNEGISTIEQIKDFVSNRNIDGKGGNAVRYVYTKNKGWIDLQHYAGVQHYGKTLMDALEPASGNSLMQDLFFGEGANNSYYSYEDLPSNAFSAEIDLDGLEGEDLFNAILEHFNEAEATTPEDAPNYEQIPNDGKDRSRLPEKEETVFDDSSPSRTSKKRVPDKSKLKTGNYIPQNRTSEPYNLDNFDPANTSKEKKKINN